MWHLASPTAEERVKSDGSPYTWDVYTQQNRVCDPGTPCHATTIICLKDPYDYAESIKTNEGELLIQGQDVYMKPADLFPSHLNLI